MFSAKSRRSRIIGILVLVLIMTIGTITGSAANGYLTTGRDTLPAPDEMQYTLTKLNKYELLYETSTVQYYYREDRDIIAIYDKRSGYVWKTGGDIAFTNTLNSAIAKANTQEEKEDAAEPKEKSLNSTYISIANSLVSIEYYESDTLKTLGSAAKEGTESKLYRIGDDNSRWKFDVEYTEIGIKLSVLVTFGEDSITYEVPYEGIGGDNVKNLSAILITPFLGASGGMAQFYDFETGMYGEAVNKYMKPGYVLVPDGSGALIRFVDNAVAFNEYIGDVYGKDLASATYYSSQPADVVPVKDPSMPVFGIAHGNNQAAFIAYAENAAEYMDIVVRPEENKNVLYTWAYPRFTYNSTYYQVYNRNGDGYFKRQDKPVEFDAKLTYRFLSGDGSTGFAANYVGMALAYRDHLIRKGELAEKPVNPGDIPLRVDFFMGDSKTGVLGTEQVVMTTTGQVEKILKQLQTDGISNINSGLIGWQKKGETLMRPDKLRYTSKIGTRSEFNKLFEEMSELGIDVSYSRDVATINEKMTSYHNTGCKHINNWYLAIDNAWLLPESTPVRFFNYATPSKIASYTMKLAKEAASHGESLTLSGITNILCATYSRTGVITSVTDAIALYRDTFESLCGGDKTGNLMFNMTAPNEYLWKYTDRYLQAPVGDSQYVFETDTVPFLQLVLNGTMEVYGPYSNFSFYTQSDILRMIDYNVFPSFIITHEPSYLLADTVSSYLYSTEFEQYEELINNIYKQVNGVLSAVSGYNWVGRDVLSEGVIRNTYQKDDETIRVLINYTDEIVYFDETFVDGLSAVVVK